MKVLSLASLALMALTFANPILSCHVENEGCENANVGDRVCACNDPNKLLQCATANGKRWLAVCQCGPSGNGICGDGRCPNGTPNDPCNKNGN